jgi:hypothetical protein
VASIKELVATKLVESAPQVKDKVLIALVEAEQDRRVKAVLKVIKDLGEAEKNSNKIRPDNSVYGEDGKPIYEGYSKAKLEEKKKNQELINRLRVALDEALSDNPSFDKVLKLSGGGDKEEKPQE